VRSGQKRKPHGICVFLQDRADHLLGRLMQARIDDLEPGVAQSSGYYLGASVVPVEAGFGDDDAISTIHFNPILGGTWCQEPNRWLTG